MSAATPECCKRDTDLMMMDATQHLVEMPRCTLLPDDAVEYVHTRRTPGRGWVACRQYSPGVIPVPRPFWQNQTLPTVRLAIQPGQLESEGEGMTTSTVPVDSSPDWQYWPGRERRPPVSHHGLCLMYAQGTTEPNRTRSSAGQAIQPRQMRYTSEGTAGFKAPSETLSDWQYSPGWEGRPRVMYHGLCQILTQGASDLDQVHPLVGQAILPWRVGSTSKVVVLLGVSPTLRRDLTLSLAGQAILPRQVRSKGEGLIWFSEAHTILSLIHI